VAGYLKARLNRAYDLFLQTAPGNSYASVDETSELVRQHVLRFYSQP
jgi:hypothetical protein